MGWVKAPTDAQLLGIAVDFTSMYFTFQESISDTFVFLSHAGSLSFWNLILIPLHNLKSYSGQQKKTPLFPHTSFNLQIKMQALKR